MQFVEDWNSSDGATRQALSDASGPGASDQAIAVLASAARALVDRGGAADPARVAAAQASEDMTTCGAPVTSPVGQRIVENAPATCAQHRVYFKKDPLERR